MLVTVDRFEGKFAVCEKEDRTMINISKDRLPPDVKEGDILIIEGDIIKIDQEATLQRKREIEEQLRELWDKKDS
jgi:hypothetical protein